MADLAVGLAKSVVEGTLSKAQAAIAEEAKLRHSAQRDLVFITGEFQMMQSFLKVANAERVENPVVMTWVRQIRELAYDVEDCIEFVVHLDKKPSWWWRMVPGWMLCCCVAPSQPLDEAVDEIEQLKARVKDVSTRNSRYNLISDTGSKPVLVQQHPAPATAAVNMLIGTATRQQQGDLTQLLAKEGIRVISVWGTGGDLGVTSIIWKAYNDREICQNFTCRAWVKLMHPFNPQEFVRSLADQFYANKSKSKQKKEEESIIGLDVLKRSTSSEPATLVDHQAEFAQRVNKERYLVVLEDLSTMTDWDTISNFFPARKNGSCIIISTQQSEVASLSIGHPYQVLELTKISADHSVYAFYKERSESDGNKGAQTTNDKKKAADDWMKENRPIGRESEMNDLRQCTYKARYYGFQVVSVWGIAGVGKSALLEYLFCDRILNDCKLLEENKPPQFQKYAWVDVCYPFNLRDFSRSLLLNFHSQYVQAHKDRDIDTVGSSNPIVECRRILERFNCLAIVDGLQSVKEWDMIQAELVSGFSRNCIIIITTEASIAKCCRGNKGELVFNVKGLRADDSYDLFKKKLPQLPATLPPKDVEDLKELISKCGGLPKVIVDIAGSLATKQGRRMEAARAINENFMHVLENNREFDSLHGLFTWMHNYFRNCPDSLKPCIFYLSIFPREQIIRRRRLVRRWIAEGYSRDNNEESAEHTGEKQFSDLVDLSIVQSQEKTAIGGMRMIFCQVNGFIREYIVNRRMEENLVFELGHNCTLTTQRTGRHLVILEHWDRDSIVFESIDFSRLRSLTVFGKWESFFISESMKLLRVLDLEDASGNVEYEDLEKMVKVLRRLKFLSLRGRREIHHLPSSLDHLRQLQSLDVRHTSILILPDNITKLEKLQYIRAGTTDIPVSAAATPPPHISSSWFCKHPSLVGVEVPRGIGKLTALHTLGVVDVSASGSKTIVKDLKKLTQLRKLGVCGINCKNIKDFFSAIKDHVHLESLSVRLNMNNNQGCCFKTEDNNQGYLDDMISLPCTNLKSLKLLGLADTLPKWESKRLSKLAKLNVEMATLTGDDMKFLGELSQLCILRVKLLQNGELNFRVLVNNKDEESYGNVKVLQITCGCSSGSLQVTFGPKTMKKLEMLMVDCRGGSSYQFTGMENLKELKEVLLVGSNGEELKQELERQFADHPNRSSTPVVKLE